MVTEFSVYLLKVLPPVMNATALVGVLELTDSSVPAVCEKFVDVDRLCLDRSRRKQDRPRQ